MREEFERLYDTNEFRVAEINAKNYYFVDKLEPISKNEVADWLIELGSDGKRDYRAKFMKDVDSQCSMFCHWLKAKQEKIEHDEYIKDNSLDIINKLR